MVHGSLSTSAQTWDFSGYFHDVYVMKPDCTDMHNATGNVEGGGESPTWKPCALPGHSA